MDAISYDHLEFLHLMLLPIFIQPPTEKEEDENEVEQKQEEIASIILRSVEQRFLAIGKSRNPLSQLEGDPRWDFPLTVPRPATLPSQCLDCTIRV